ncbi:MAG TPA: hypothetical protein DDZ39_00435 [Flavobacteriaceae bacterium]|nr:hypothetical protein [Flavobacteriaceae bacterium]
MKKTLTYILIITILISGVYFVLIQLQLRGYKEKGNVLIEKVYNFNKENGSLPNSHDDLECDLEMGEGPYYKKLNDTVFIVYFNIGFDDSIIFNSREKKWEVNM